MSEVNPLIAAILATAIIEPRPKKNAARRAVEAYREMISELGKEAPEASEPRRAHKPRRHVNRGPRRRVSVRKA